MLTLFDADLNKNYLIIKIGVLGKEGLRLSELGLTIGAIITPILKPIFNEPILIKINGYYLALDETFSKQIIVKEIK